MKLLILTHNFPDKYDKFTSNIFIKEQVKALSKFVDNIYVLVAFPWGMQFKRKRKYENYSFDNVDVHFFSYLDPLFPIEWKWKREWWINRESQILTKYIKKHNVKFDIIHAHYTWPNGAVGVKLKNIFNVPVVITEHTSETFKRYITQHDTIAIKTWNDADVIIRVRKGDIVRFEEVEIDKNKIYYIPNGYSKNFKIIDQLKARKILKLPPDKKILLYVGNMYSEIKGHRILLEAFKKTIEKNQNVLLVLVGDGKLKDTFIGIANALKIKEYVIFAGAKPHHEIPLWLNAADLFILPSLSEGNPTVMFEALGVGLPFVGTTVGGVPEIITSEDYGLLCPPRDPECLADKILIALEKEWDREKIKKYAEQFTWENIAKKIMKVYQQTFEKVK